MPELPEVETIRRGIDRHLVGRRISQVDGAGGRLLRKNPGGLNQITSALSGALVKGTARRGKFMWLILEGDAEPSLVIHLGMSGQVRVQTQNQGALGRHEHLRLTMDDGSSVSFVDPRMFGHLTVAEMTEGPGGREVPDVVTHIAPDLLELGTEDDFEHLADRFGRSGRMVKTMLLDQGLVSGVGNIYADEGLFRAGIHGAQRGDQLSGEQREELICACHEVIKQATGVGGTSFDALYVDVDGNPGYFGRELAVYGRAAKPCRRCQSDIRRIVLQGRSHFFCPECQPAAHERPV